MSKEFVLDYQEYCFLCLRQIPSSTVKIEPEATTISPPLAYSLQILLRYLKTDMRQVFSQQDIPPQLLQMIGESGLKVELCEACALVNQQFSKMHLQMDKIQFEIVSRLSRLQIVHGKLSEFEKAGHYEEIHNKAHSGCSSDLTDGLIWKLEIFDMLREEAKQKCFQKLNEMGSRVQTKKLTMAETNATFTRYKSNSNVVLSTGTEYTPQSTHEALSGPEDNNIGQTKMGSPNADLIPDDDDGDNVSYSFDGSNFGELVYSLIKLKKGISKDCQGFVRKMVNDFVLECREHCFLCLSQIPSSPAVKLEPDTRVASPPPKYSLLMLSGCLKMDMRKVFSRKEDIPPQLLQMIGESGLKVELCENCALVNQQFSNLYQQLEIIQMEMTSSLQTIHGKLCEAEEAGYHAEFLKKAHSGYLSGLDDGLIWKLEIFDMLREEAKQKCFQTLNNVGPRVKVKKLTMEEIDEQCQSNSNVVLNTTPPTIHEAFSEPEDNNIGIGEIKMRSPNRNLISDDDGRNDCPYSSDGSEGGSHGGISVVEVEQDCEISVPEGSFSNIEHQSTMISTKRGSRKYTIPSKEFRTSEGRSKIVYKCEECGKGFASKYLCNRHHQSIHLKVRYKCQDCGNKFSSKTHLNRHHQSVHLNVKYKCQECEKEFSSKAHCDRHYRDVHLKKSIHHKMRCKCQECGKEFSSQSHLNRHHQSIHLKVRYKCQDCGDKFSSKTHLNRHHQSVHLNVKYKCQECEKEFSSKAHCDRHYRDVHLKKSIHHKMRCKCQECGKEFSSQSHLNRHHQSIHLKVPRTRKRILK